MGGHQNIHNKLFFFLPPLRICGSGIKSVTSRPWLTEECVFKLDVNHYVCPKLSQHTHLAGGVRRGHSRGGGDSKELNN